VAWSVARIASDWLGDGRVACRPDRVVELFDLVEATFGADWLEARRQPRAKGAVPTLAVLSVGQLIEAVRDLPGSEGLLDRIRRGDQSAQTEALVAAMLRSGPTSPHIRLESAITPREGQRKQDLIVAEHGDEVFIEVAQPNVSREAQEARKLARHIADLIKDAQPWSTATEVYFHREPTSEEIPLIVDATASLAQQGVELRRELEGLATLAANHTRPGVVALVEHGDPYRPGVGVGAVAHEGDQVRHAAVRLPFTDERAEDFLRREARQLPRHATGVVALDVSDATGGMHAWKGLIERRLRPNQHTRVAATVLMESRHVPTPDGEAWGHHSQLIVNDHAARPAPEWLLRLLETWQDDDWHTLRY
jgi:hypothetical protein